MRCSEPALDLAGTTKRNVSAWTGANFSRKSPQPQPASPTLFPGPVPQPHPPRSMAWKGRAQRLTPGMTMVTALIKLGQYPSGYWRLEKPMSNGGWQGINPATMKPGSQPETHVPFPPK